MNFLFILLMTLLAALGMALLWSEGLLKSRAALLLSAFLLLVALGARLLAFDYETLDYKNFLAHWALYFRQYGGFAALSRQVGNYNIPYLYFLALFSYLPVRDLYLIKWLSTLSDLLLAWGTLRLVSHVTRRPGRLLASFFTVLFLPTVFINSALWGQCDSLYVAPLLLGIDCGLRNKPRGAMILAAVAFGFKLQAVFVLPVFAVIWMARRYPLRHFLYFPLSYVVLVLPAVLLGRPFLDTVTLYFSQTGSIGSGLNYNSPSIFAIFWHVRDEKLAAGIAIAAAAVFMLNMLAVAWVNRAKLSDQAVLGMALLFAIGIPFFLPHMHDRYFYAADILAVVLAFSWPVYAFAAPLVQFASLLGYYAYFYMVYLLPMRCGSATLIIAFALGLLCFIEGLLRSGAKTRAERVNQNF